MNNLSIIVHINNDPTVGLSSQTWRIDGFDDTIVADEREHIKELFRRAFDSATGYAGFPIRVTFSDEFVD